ncbi:MAG: YciI family protein [Robiginitomaculum sp.]|nr:YciI family protein [Robiginitomaculum sp.]
MKFMVYTQDKDGALDVRLAHRDAHLAHLKAEGKVQVLSAGPWLADDNETMKGSLLVVEANCVNCVTGWIKDDPYVKAGLTAKITIHPLGGWTDF